MSGAVIELETEDFSLAAQLLERLGAEPLEFEVTRLSLTLDGCAAMAGSDPGGAAWASAYDPAARAALYAAQDAINAVHKLAAMLAQTARNYAAADAASSPLIVREAVAALPRVGSYFLPMCPVTVAGGSGGEPSGWGLIAGAVGWVWPNGHQDRLRTAAAAWRASAAAFDDAAGRVVDAAGPARTDRLPEAGDVRLVCSALADQLRALADVHRSLGLACDQLADHLDEAHHEVISELESLVEWTAGIEIASGLLSIVTFGGSEAVGQAGEAARISATAARVAAIIERFTALARTLASSVAVLAARADRVAGAMTGLLDVRLSVAVTVSVRTMPGVGRVLDLGNLARLQLTLRRDWPEISAMLQTAAREKGNYTLGTVTRREADVIGRAWVGDGARLASDGRTWVSRDGLRQYRPFKYKVKRGVWQANIQWRVKPEGEWLSNGHIHLKGRP